MGGPLDRRETDTARSWAALQDYAAMGPGRSLRELATRYRRQSVDEASTARPPTVRFETLGTWSTSADWQQRIAEYDAAQAAATEAERQAIRKARRIALEEADWRDGEELRGRVAELLSEVPKFLRRSETLTTQGGELVRVITLALAAGPGELARALKIASELQRLSVGEPTEIHKQVESEIGAFLDLLESNLSPEEFARVVSVAARGRATGE